MEKLLAELKKELPPIFAGKEIDRLLGNAVRWRTIQNMRASNAAPEDKKIPDNCFVRSGARKMLILRDPFVEWWVSQLEFE